MAGTINISDVGPTGYTGSKGDIGYTGSKGDQGVQGNIGYTGSQGIQGDIGYTGSKGDQGVQGYTGSVGTIGNTGYTGSLGYTGSAGAGYTGSQGYTGSKGDQGIQGIQGYTGSMGMQGNTGYTGSTGGAIGEETYTFYGSSTDTFGNNISEGSPLEDILGNDLEITFTVTNGFSKALVTFQGNYYNNTSNSNYAGISLQRKVNSGSYTTIRKHFVPDYTSSGRHASHFTTIDTHGAGAGDSITYRFINSTYADGYGSVNPENIRQQYGVSGDTFGIKEIT
jgi:hypothetical protein